MTYKLIRTEIVSHELVVEAPSVDAIQVWRSRGDTFSYFSKTTVEEGEMMVSGTGDEPRIVLDAAGNVIWEIASLPKRRKEKKP